MSSGTAYANRRNTFMQRAKNKTVRNAVRIVVFSPSLHLVCVGQLLRLAAIQINALSM